MKTLAALATVALLLSPTLAGASGDPPEQTRALLTDATKQLTEREFTGIYTYRSLRVTSKKNGNDRQERAEVFEFRGGESAGVRKLVSASRDGEDFTDQRREEIKNAEAEGRRGGRCS